MNQSNKLKVYCNPKKCFPVFINLLPIHVVEDFTQLAFLTFKGVKPTVLMTDNKYNNKY